MVWIHTSKLNVFAKIIPTVCTQETYTTRHAGLHRHPIPFLDILHVAPYFEYYASAFMSEDAISINNKTANLSTFPEVYIGPRRYKSQY
jgi:hypothetical protein